MTTAQEVIDSLQPMFAKAREENLWFFNKYYGLWLSPAELEHWQNIGRYMFGPVNWELRHPQTRIEELDREISKLEEEKANLRNRMKKEQS